jgi:hypothetical protein
MFFVSTTCKAKRADAGLSLLAVNLLEPELRLERKTLLQRLRFRRRFRFLDPFDLAASARVHLT